MKHLSKDGETVTITKMNKLDPPSCERDGNDLTLLFLDVETTGLSFESDRIIQLSFRPVLVNNKNFEISAIAKSKTYFNDPGFSLSEEIKKLTNIDDSQLKGEEINWSWLHATISKADFVVCHNAYFDRGMIESEFKRAGLSNTETIWACSMNQVHWRDFCRPSRSLEVLCAWSGFFYDSHQASNDVDAMIQVLRKNNKIEELLTTAKSSEFRVFAMGSPREKNVELKKKKYRWDPNVSCWYKNFNNSETAELELVWLRELDSSIEPQMFEVDPKYRFAPE